MSRNNTVIVRQPELIVCSIDYDGCIATHENVDRSGNISAHLKTMLIENPQSNLVLMIGSARQSILSDWYYEKKNENGSCWLFLTLFLEKFKLKHPDLADRISLDPFLLEDIFRNTEPGYHFDVRLNSFSMELENECLRRLSMHQYGIDISWQDAQKKSLIYAQLHYIGTKHPGKKVAFHFYDDWDFVLNGLKSLYGLRVELIPHHFSVHFFQYNGGHFIGNIPFKVQGVGLVDNHYPHNVKNINSASWMSSRHEDLTNHILREPNVSLAVHLYSKSSNQHRFIQCLREKWGQLIFEFLDRLSLKRNVKINMVKAWLSDAVNSKDISFISHCLRYVHPNVCVNYFVEALENEDDLLANAFVPILSSYKLGELSRNDLNLLLFAKKKYDWLRSQFGFSNELARLIKWCCDADKNGLTKSVLKNLLDDHFIDHQGLSLSIDLRRFCYHVAMLSGNDLTAEDRVALHVIVKTHVRNDRSFESRLLSDIILAQLALTVSVLPEDAEKIRQKYLHAVVIDYPSSVQKCMIKKIESQCGDQMSKDMFAAYRALKFAILFVPLSADDRLEQLYDVIRRWEKSDTIIPGKTHCQLLAEYDRALEVAATARSRFSFFSCCCDEGDIFSHKAFVNSLPVVAIKELALENHSGNRYLVNSHE